MGVTTTKKYAMALVAVLIAILLVYILARDADNSDEKVSDAYWPQWQGVDKDAISKDTGLLKKWPDAGPEMLWSVDGIGAGFSSVTIADGLIYISGMVDREGVITAIEPDGTVKWRQAYGPEYYKSFPGARASVTIDGGNLYIFSGTGVATCLDAKSGDKKWSVDVIEKFGGRHHMWGYGESLLVVDDKVICTAGGEGASIVALSVDDGGLIWKTKELDEKASYSSPIVVDRGGKKLILQILWQHLVAIDAANGTVVAKYDTKDYKPKDQRRGSETSTNTPVYDDGFIYLTSGYQSGSAKLKLSEDGTKITKVWENHDLDVHHGGVVLVDGHIYGSNWLTNSTGAWVCVNWETGETVYEQDWDKNKGSIGYADGMLYCYQEEDGNLALVKATPEKFEITSIFEITMGKEQHWAHPIICGGVLYMRHGDVLMAYDVIM